MVDEGEKESVKSLVPLTGLFIATHTHTHPPTDRRDCRRFRSLLIFFFFFFLPWFDVICCLSESVLSAEYIVGSAEPPRAYSPRSHQREEICITAPEEYRLYTEKL